METPGKIRIVMQPLYHTIHELNLRIQFLQRRYFAVSGWRSEKLRNSRQRWIKVNHPPYERSPIKRINDTCEKIMYVTNGTINKSLTDTWLKESKRSDNYIVKNNIIHTPCLVFCKERYHTLLESLAMEEVIDLENIAQDILNAFNDAQAQLGSYKDEEMIHRPIND